MMFKIKTLTDTQTQIGTYEITGDGRQLELLATALQEAAKGDRVEKTLATPGYPDVVLRILPHPEPTQSVLRG